MTLSSYMVEAQSAQTRKDTRKGNREYRSNHFDRAEVDYRRALHHDSTAYRAHYNLGNTLYRQKKYEEATCTTVATATSKPVYRKRTAPKAWTSSKKL